MRTSRWNTPYKVLSNDKDFRLYTQNIEYKDKVYGYPVLNKVFDKVLKNPFLDGGYTFLLSCDFNYIIPQLAAKAIENKAVEMNKLPYWYNVIRNHKTQDEYLELFIGESGAPDLLIIDGVFAKTNVNNIDKVRELLNRFEDTPIFIIISGGVGPDIFENIVYAPYNRFIHFGDVPRKKNIVL